jgi:serine/threonine-protein kinase
MDGVRADATDRPGAPQPPGPEPLGVPSGLPYIIEHEVGRGGMATVYLAHDVKHGRRVAVKVLHAELAAVLGPERFLQEIRVLATLQHPHILGLLDSGVFADEAGELRGRPFYVMPYLEGESLRQRLAREGPLPVADAVKIAGEVAGALDYAHRHGVIHRDVKPENIMLHDGQALVADFGIALAVRTAGGARLTQTGVTLGTPQYMSPEQAMGERAVDARSDIYALGAVLHEMLAGGPPFSGASAQAIVAKALSERPPPLRTLRDTVPEHVERAVRTALARLPADRHATAAAFAAALSAETGAPTPRVMPRPARRIARGAAALAGAGALVAVASWLGRRSAVADSPWSAFTQLTDASGVEDGPSLSPDGASFAYVSRRRGTWDVYVQRVGGRNPVLVAGDSARDEVWPAYSPDGARIAYAVRGGGIFVVGATGESTRRVTTFGSHPAWSPDGRRLVFCSAEVTTPYSVGGRGTLWIVASTGGEPSRIGLTGEGDAYQPAWSPSGDHIAYFTTWRGQRDLAIVDTGGGAPVLVTNDAAVDWAPVWTPDGRELYFASDRGGTMGIWRLAVDARSGRPTGAPTLVAAGAEVSMDLPRLSKDGTALLLRSQLESVNPAAVAFDPSSGRLGTVSLLQHRTGILAPSDVSPDGRWLALVSSPDRQQDVFLMRADGTELTRLTDDAARDDSPRFTPDGSALTFQSNQGGAYQAWSIRLDGSGRTRLTELRHGEAIAPMFAPDGRRLVFERYPQGGSAIGTAPWPLTERTITPLQGMQVDGGTLSAARWSGDGRWLTGGITTAAGDVGGNGIYDVATRRTRRLSVDADGNEAAWLPGYTRLLYFTATGALVSQSAMTLERRVVAARLPYPPDLVRSIVASPDGRTLYYGARQVEANIWLVRRSPSAASAR